MIKFKELVEKYPNIDFNRYTFDIKTEYKDGMIVKTFSPKYEPLELNDIEIVYYWCYGGLSKETIDKIEKALKTKDYKLFREIKYSLLYTDLYSRFPDHFSLYSNYIPIGWIDIDEYLFSLLDYQESENG